MRLKQVQKFDKLTQTTIDKKRKTKNLMQMKSSDLK